MLGILDINLHKTSVKRSSDMISFAFKNLLFFFFFFFFFGGGVPRPGGEF